ncbi:hypothetical protein [Scytonema sp. NUACC26]|uniref:hypothetical protein n=1 Tax=Scytonema sp. NUACC26 TaxID=3140176 RepID=UPI0034DC04DA
MSSNNSHILVQLNRELPFVKAVFDVIEGRSDLDTVVHILKSEEQAYGVFIHANEFHALWGLSLVPKQKPLNASEMLALARTDWDKFRENYIEVGASSLNALNQFQLKLNCFLDATSLVLQGSEFANECLLTLDDGSIWTFSFREWGEYLFEWANHNEWMQQFGSFNEAAFAFYCDKIINDYQQWANIAFAAIKQKCSI